MAPAFFPFNPRATRWSFLLAAFVCAGLAFWALQGTFRHTERFGELRAGVSVGLMLAFLFACFRLRPRACWGVTLDDEGLTLAHPFFSGTRLIPWARVNRLWRTGKRQDTVMLVLDDDSRILLPHHLFPRRAAFEALVAALRQKLPEPELDA